MADSRITVPVAASPKNAEKKVRKDRTQPDYVKSIAAVGRMLDRLTPADAQAVIEFHARRLGINA